MPVRNLFIQPEKMLDEVDIKPGCHVLDFGCGPGVFSLNIARRTTDSGRVNALDIHPLAVKSVEKKAVQEGLNNIKTILSSCSTSLSDNCVDLAILFDVFHMLDNQEKVLMEIHRVLKSEGILYFSDHHMKEPEILERLSNSGLFKLLQKGKRTYSFKTQN